MKRILVTGASRGVGKGVNFYSIEREMALGKGLAQEVEREAQRRLRASAAVRLPQAGAAEARAEGAALRQTAVAQRAAISGVFATPCR